MTVPADTVARLMESSSTVAIKASCQASIWLLGGAAPCNKDAGHDGDHEVRIQWRVQ